MNAALPCRKAPVSPLSRYRLLSPTASVRVSPLCLGSMNFGDAWAEWMGKCTRQDTERILDYFYEQVRNFIDTANSYQFEQSEIWIGEWMRKRGNRDEMVVATKYTTNFRDGPDQPRIMANFTGNGTKSLRVSLDASLRKLQTDYVDILYVHWWDYSASIPEIMQSLNQLVASGKVLFLGISDAPAWVVSKANEYARNHGLRQFCIYQGRWSAACRDLERDVIPMCKAEGMAIAPWGSLGGGRFKSDEARGSNDGRQLEATEDDIKISKTLQMIANRKDTVITSIALAYVMHKSPYVFPVIGGRKVEHLRANIEALTIELTEEDVAEIDGALPFDLGFPHNFLWGRQVPKSPQDIWLLSTAGNFDYVENPRPINVRVNGEKNPSTKSFSWRWLPYRAEKPRSEGKWLPQPGYPWS
ncbi:uncharacterized protein UV8b_01551 [Ustilaginoidea virens]|uniref:NADP-dependent oxidoreductase domain-containing protein n=1 Tax=Ustilaginoidea virens TaxID=1159556 RepID=A0A8E5HL86_USTVR|nr:uncharacterized protein UV8b_01551 [Ustilaginoidea virens]QUC17310.1 hypothetical protein UV8b_01551 [Ustilaginoidea virens]